MAPQKSSIDIAGPERPLRATSGDRGLFRELGADRAVGFQGFCRAARRLDVLARSKHASLVKKNDASQNVSIDWL